jgi:hypothetical protein
LIKKQARAQGSTDLMIQRIESTKALIYSSCTGYGRVWFAIKRSTKKQEKQKEMEVKADAQD